MFRSPEKEMRPLRPLRPTEIRTSCAKNTLRRAWPRSWMTHVPMRPCDEQGEFHVSDVLVGVSDFEPRVEGISYIRSK